MEVKTIKTNIKKILGYTILAMFWLGMIALAATDIGLVPAIKTLALATVISALLFWAIGLIV